jgi:hypothetical protein
MMKVREQKHGDELQSHLLSTANQLTAFERQENQIHISNWDQVLSVIADGAPLDDGAVDLRVVGADAAA